jgi:hypothetical protein
MAGDDHGLDRVADGEAPGELVDAAEAALGTLDMLTQKLTARSVPAADAPRQLRGELVRDIGSGTPSALAMRPSNSGSAIPTSVICCRSRPPLFHRQPGSGLLNFDLDSARDCLRGGQLFLGPEGEPPSPLRVIKSLVSPAHDQLGLGIIAIEGDLFDVRTLGLPLGGHGSEQVACRLQARRLVGARIVAPSRFVSIDMHRGQFLDCLAVPHEPAVRSDDLARLGLSRIG